jgi:hypothetical protein
MASRIGTYYKSIKFAAFAIVMTAGLLHVSSANAIAGPTPVYRMYNNKAIQHLMTIDSYENTTLLTNPVWKEETSTFQAYSPINGSCINGTEPVYRIVQMRSGEHLLTADTNEVNFWTVTNKTWYTEGIGFCVYSTQVAGTGPVYRLHNSQNGEHLLTADANEANSLNGHYNWSLEVNGRGGVVFYADL